MTLASIFKKASESGTSKKDENALIEAEVTVQKEESVCEKSSSVGMPAEIESAKNENGDISPMIPIKDDKPSLVTEAENFLKLDQIKESQQINEHRLAPPSDLASPKSSSNLPDSVIDRINDRLDEIVNAHGFSSLEDLH